MREISPIKTDKTMSRLNLNSELLFDIKFQQLDSALAPPRCQGYKVLNEAIWFHLTLIMWVQGWPRGQVMTTSGYKKVR